MMLEITVSDSTLIEDIKFQIQDRYGYSWDDVLIKLYNKELKDNESIIWKRVIIFIILN